MNRGFPKKASSLVLAEGLHPSMCVWAGVGGRWETSRFPWEVGAPLSCNQRRREGDQQSRERQSPLKLGSPWAMWQKTLSAWIEEQSSPVTGSDTGIWPVAGKPGGGYPLRPAENLPAWAGLPQHLSFWKWMDLFSSWKLDLPSIHYTLYHVLGSCCLAQSECEWVVWLRSQLDFSYGWKIPPTLYFFL